MRACVAQKQVVCNTSFLTICKHIASTLFSNCYNQNKQQMFIPPNDRLTKNKHEFVSFTSAYWLYLDQQQNLQFHIPTSEL